MPKPKIHYKHPKFGYHACGMGSPSPKQITSNLEQVTCQKCLETATAKKRSPGRPPTGNAKIKVTIRLSQELVNWIDSKGDRTSVITKAIQFLEQASQV